MNIGKHQPIEHHGCVPTLRSDIRDADNCFVECFVFNSVAFVEALGNPIDIESCANTLVDIGEGQARFFVEGEGNALKPLEQ